RRDICLAFVTERIELRRNDERRRKAAEVRAEQRSRPGALTGRRRRQVLPPKPEQVVPCDEVSVAEVPLGGGRARRVEHRGDEELEAEGRPAPVPCRERNCRGEPSPAAIAANRHPRRVEAERLALLVDPFGCGDRVVEGGGELVLRRQPILH